MRPARSMKKFPGPSNTAGRNDARFVTDPKTDGIGRDLVLDELFDLTFYQALHKRSQGPTRQTLEELIATESRHWKFWQDFFGRRAERLDPARRVKLGVLLALCRLFGETAVHLSLEAIEIYGVRKYLQLWETYKDTA